MCGCALGIVLWDSYSQQHCWFPLALNTLLFKVILMKALSMPWSEHALVCFVACWTVLLLFVPSCECLQSVPLRGLSGELSRGEAAAPRAGLKPGHGASQRSPLWFALKLLLSNLCRLLQESVSSLVHCWLDPGSLPESAASLHPSPLPGWTHCHGGTAEQPGRARARECLRGLEGRHRSLQRLSVAFLVGIWAELLVTAWRRLQEGGWELSWAERWAVSSICPGDTLSAAGSSGGCCGSLSPMTVTREIFLS